jgi:hypothetical protein
LVWYQQITLRIAGQASDPAIRHTRVNQQTPGDIGAFG